jgi:acetyl esterase
MRGSLSDGMMRAVPLDPDIAAAIERATSGGYLPLHGAAPDQARASYRELSLLRRGDGYVPEPVADVTDTQFSGAAGPLTARLYSPVDPVDAVVVYLHGGGWVVGDLDTHDPVCRGLANGTRAVVVSVGYRLAPEAPHPAPLRDCMAALRWVSERWPGHRLAVAGDSAGGGLAAACALQAREEPELRLVAQLLIYPGLDPLMSQPSVVENAEGYFLAAVDMRWFYDHYLPQEAMRSDPAVNLLAATDLSGLPPAVITVAEFDPLRDEGALYASRLQDAGVEVTLIRAPGMVHGYFGMTEISAAAAATADEVRGAFAALLTR